MNMIVEGDGAGSSGCEVSSTTSDRDDGSEVKSNDVWGCKLAENCKKLHECLGAQGDHQTIELVVDSLVTQLEEERACTPENRSSSLQLLLQLVDMLNSYFQYTGRPRYIDLVIRCQSRAETLVEDNDSDRGGLISNLGSSYLGRFRQSRDLEDLNVSIACHLKALQYTPQEHENMPIIIHSLGNSYYTLFQLTHSRNDIDKSIDFYTQAITFTPQEHPYRPGQLDSLGQSYCSRFAQFGELLDIEKAIELQNQTLELTAPSNPNIPGWLRNLGISYKTRFTRLGHLDDINKAIEHLTRAVRCTPKDNPNMLASLATLGEAHQSRFNRGGSLDDINLAIEYQTQAVSATPDGHMYKHIRLGSLGGSYMSRFRQFGKAEDLEDAVSFLSKGLDLGPIDSEDVELLHDIGNTYSLRFEYLGELNDVDEAINYLTRAETLASETHVAMASILTSLGGAYLRRFVRLGDSADIDKALDYQTRALELQSPEHADTALILNNLGVLHRCRFDRLRKPADMNNALKHLTQAVSLLSEDHAGMPGILHNLADLYITRYQLQPTPEDIDTAIDYQARAVALTPEGHVQLPNFANSLGLFYRHRYGEQGEIKDIDQAIHWQSRAVMLTPQEHVRMPLWLGNLGDSFLDRTKKERDTPSFYSAIECYRKSAQHSAQSPNKQLTSAIKWAKLVSIPNLADSSDGPLEAFQTVMDLVPHVVWLGTRIGKRYKDARKIKDIASDAAAFAIKAGKYELAVEWLEEGRSVVWNQTLQLRNPFDDLATVDPLMAENLRQVASELHDTSSLLQTSSTALKDTIAQEAATQKHHRLAENYQRLVAAARQLPGFHDFLRPAKASALIGAAQSGPLVIVNVSGSRCDALVICPGAKDITHIPLSELSLDAVASAHRQLDQSLRRNHVRDRGIRIRSSGEEKDMFEQVLIMLWTCIAKPVLDVLEYLPTAEVLPRITWCTTGALSFLPIHASGYYDRPQAKLSDYAISSYAPTLSILLSARSSCSNLPGGILAVGQESTPGKTPLPGTKTELENIRKHIHERQVYSQLDGSHATSHSVLSAMEQHGWVHFACHAYQNPYNPIKSGFFLHEDTLYLEQIAHVSSRNQGLAFLSACQTATGDQELPDEVVHLASGMLMAGYSSVIATMWSIVDEDAPLIADEVYSRVLEGGRMDTGGAARALHQAVCRLREKVGDKAFSRWVPYVHMGI
ncbi:unnamed protein product [Rhizoctonia solani]|uniref:CHAT domain-containing protein n=1 Tax=Rhizoctonia solani TaxID=456999 RepID=A0A8H3B9P2_9AGAM|nr:unnamed protein product [Rhizoctonia solani]